MTKPASEYDIRFGHGLLKSESAKWGRYAAITTLSAWQAAQLELSQQPAAIGYNEWLDRNHLIEVSDSLPDDIDLVVGIGAGRALDHAKLVATRKNKPLVQVPTALSTGAIIHGFVADWNGRQIVGTLAEIDCEHVLVDYDVVLKAPERLNTAGLGDVLCGFAAIAEWFYGEANGTADAVDYAKINRTLSLFNQIVRDFPASLDDRGELTPESVRIIMKAVQDRDDNIVRDENAPGADHAFCFAIEIANDRYWIHGETCALGAVIIAWYTEHDPEVIVRWLDQCKVRWRPDDLDITRAQFAKALSAWPKWLGDGTDGKPESRSIIVQRPMTPQIIDGLWDWLTSRNRPESR